MNAKQKDKETQEKDKVGAEKEGKRETKLHRGKGASACSFEAGSAGAADGEVAAENDDNATAAALDATAPEGEVEGGAAENLREDAEQLKDRLLRLSADFDNYRKRSGREKEDWIRYASQNMMERLLPVMDSLDAASQAVTSAGQEAKNVAEGFLMIHKQLADILNQEGLSEIPAMDGMFDPNLHEAVMTVSAQEGQEDNQVVMVLRKGYMYKDKVLRPAMVQVAKA